MKLSIQAEKILTLFNDLCSSDKDKVKKLIVENDVNSIDFVHYHKKKIAIQNVKYDIPDDKGTMLATFLESTSSEIMIEMIYSNTNASFSKFCNMFSDDHHWVRCYYDNNKNLVLINRKFDEDGKFNLNDHSIRAFDMHKHIIDNKEFSFDETYELTWDQYYGVHVEKLINQVVRKLYEN